MCQEKLEMEFIVTIHWYPGTPKAYPAVEAPDAKTAIQIVRQAIGHSFTMPAVAVPVDTQPTSQQSKKNALEPKGQTTEHVLKVKHLGLVKPEDAVYNEGFKINILPQPKNVPNEDSETSPTSQQLKRELIKIYLQVLLAELKGK
jgi:hypothetical protein